ncbi:MAG: hypothetical protein K0S25_624, partial [Bacillus sp. (in: firmicutes)]|nr:hypothetical protein [Bacillus sp. (in: firmicutes)]
IKEIPAEIGTPFDTSLRTMGTIPHSHEGKKKPKKLAKSTARILFFGIILAIISSVRKIWIIPEIKTPSVTNGKASIKIEINIVFICKNDLGNANPNI